MFHSHLEAHHRHSRLFKRGDLKYVVLDLLKDKPSHGYEVIVTLEERFHGLYSPNAGSIYPVLQLLEDMGYVTSNVADGKKVYTISEAGTRFLQEQQETTNSIKNRVGGWLGPGHASYVRDVKVALNYSRDIRRLVGDIAVHRDPGKIAKARKILAAAFNEIEKVHEES